MSNMVTVIVLQLNSTCFHDENYSGVRFPAGHREAWKRIETSLDNRRRRKKIRNGANLKQNLYFYNNLTMSYT